MASSLFQPRLPSSLKSTELPAEFLTKVTKVFTDQFPRETAAGEFIVDGRVYPEEIVMRAGYLESGRLRQINFEVSVDLPKHDPAAASASLEDGGEEETAESKTMTRIYLAIDALGSLMEEYFQEGSEEEMDLPLRWREMDFEGEQIYLQHSTINTRLEEEADRILRMAGLSADSDAGMIEEGYASEDALGNAEVDTDLAMDVQRAIRDGKYKLPSDHPFARGHADDGHDHEGGGDRNDLN